MEPQKGGNLWFSRWNNHRILFLTLWLAPWLFARYSIGGMDDFQEEEAGSKGGLAHFYRFNLLEDINIGNFGNNGLLFPSLNHLIYSLFKGQSFFQPGQYLISLLAKGFHLFLLNGFPGRKGFLLRIDKLIIL